jgi:BA14K-like protein
MEPIMISLKVLSTVAAMALVLPMVVPAESFAQQHPGGGARGGGARAGGVGRAAPGPRMGGGGGGARFSGGGPRVGGGGPGYRGGYGGGYRGGGGFVPGVVAGAVIGGAIASQGYGYYGGPAYAPGYYDDQSYDDSAVVQAPAGGDDAVAYCMQTYRSYDPRTGTYMGTDGYRHPCP